MIAKAPGKVVLSGSYAVLCGAPALVAAVDRYAIADTSRPAARSTPEIETALAERPGHPPSPHIDAAALRSADGEDRKLGLGSSAAILVAALAALEMLEAGDLDDDSLQQRVFEPALRAHRAAQGGGSGIDVVASTFGQLQRCQLASDGSIDRRIAKLPTNIVIEIWSSRRAASTPEMLQRFWALRERKPAAFRDVVRDLSLGAEAAAEASDASSFIDGCRTQLEALARLGDLAASPIVTPPVARLNEAARRIDAVALPSGAGGGDIVLWMGTAPPDGHGLAVAAEAGLSRIPIALGARGAHCASSGARP